MCQELQRLLSSYRINRYIVGCKYLLHEAEELGRIRINRYIVGCKYTTTPLALYSATGINRYIVGCKSEGTEDAAGQQSEN